MNSYGTVFCVSEAPNKESAVRVHKEAHGLNTLSSHLFII